MHTKVIYALLGRPVDEILINDEISSIDGRVSKGSKHWYKGIGTKYHSHYTTNPLPHHRIIER